MFLDMRLNGYEMFRDEAADLSIGIGLGLQPSASPSSGRGAEVDQKRTA
jgi:hypothetical protein